MKSQTWKMTVVLMGAASLCRGAQDRLTVEVWDYAGLPKEVLRGAVVAGGAALRASGIDTSWTLCTAAEGTLECPKPEPPAGRKVYVIITARAAQSPAGATTDQGGLALTGEVALAQPRAWVFYSMAQRMAEAAGRSTDLVLASIVIHEVGHVLGLKHQTTGIMRPALMPHDVDELSRCRGFSPAEVRQLHAGVRRLNAVASPL